MICILRQQFDNIYFQTATSSAREKSNTKFWASCTYDIPLKQKNCLLYRKKHCTGIETL